MSDDIKEKYIKTSPKPVSFEGTKKILSQMNDGVCRIYNHHCKGTGFFTKIPFKSKLLPVLITNNHVIDKNDLKNNKEITLYLKNDNKIKELLNKDNELFYYRRNRRNRIQELLELRNKNNEILNDNKIKKLKIDNNRLRYTNEKLDITIIEIKENEDKLNNEYLELDDNIINYFK